MDGAKEEEQQEGGNQALDCEGALWAAGLDSSTCG